MKKENVTKALNSLGILFVAVGIIRLGVLLFAGNLTYLIWFSNHVMLLLGIGVLMRSKLLVTAELCIALVPETLWSLDFLSKLLFNRYLFGVTKYFFDQGLNLETLSGLQHLFIVPLGLIALCFLGVSNKAWKISFLHVSVLWILGFIAGKEYNLNCIFKHCIVYFENLTNYLLAWPIIMFSLILLSNFLLLRLNRIKK